MDATGFWVGTYWYSIPGQPVVPFLANIDDTNGRLQGSTSEPDTILNSATRLEAFLIGTREGSRLEFAKVYDGSGPLAHRVEYVGSLSEDGRTIRGIWLLEDWHGSFEMTRELLSETARNSEATSADVILENVTS